MVGINKLCLDLFSAATSNQCMTKFLKWNKGLSVKDETAKQATEASVLLPLCLVNDNPSLLYTLIAENLREISFPGGEVNKNEDHIDAALRNTREIIGLPSKKVNVWGKGNPIWTRNLKVVITPVVGVVKDFNEREFNVNSSIVEKVFTVPLETLCNQKNHFHTQFTNGMVQPVFAVNGLRIWGLTAYLTHLLLSSLLTGQQYKNYWIYKNIISDVPADLRDKM